MKYLFSLSVAAAMCCSGLQASAQNVKLKDGSLDALKGVSRFNIRYDYSNMTVTTKNKPEDEFVATKKEEYNKKEAGSGDKWAASWVADRENRYAVQFKEEFEKQSDMQVGDFPEEKYTLVFHTMHTETGFNIGITRRNAQIDGEVLVVETANPDKVIARVVVEDCQGRTFGGYDFDTGVRLQEAYAVAGKGFGKFLKKKTK